MASAPTIREKYHILNFPLSEDWIENLLGRIVRDKDNPTAITAPRQGGRDGAPQKIVPDLADKPVAYTSLHYLLNEFKDISQSAKITKFFQEKASKATSTETTITGIDVQRIDISNIDYKLEELMKNTVYKADAEKILVDTEGNLLKLGMVTGIFVSKSLTVTTGAKKEIDVNGGFKAPIGKAAGLPTTAFDVEATAQYEKGNEKNEEFKIDVPSVFAVAYTDIGLRPVQPAASTEKESFRMKLKKKMSKKANPNLVYEAFIDTSPGAKFFHGSDSESSSDDEADAKSTTSTHIEESAQVTQEENVPHVFTTPASVF